MVTLRRHCTGVGIGGEERPRLPLSEGSEYVALWPLDRLGENLMKRVAAKTRTKTSGTKAAKASSRPQAKAGKVQGAPVALDPAFEAVAAAFAKDPNVGLGRMFSSKSVLNVNGKIFAMFVRGQFVAKLPKARVAELVSTGAGVFFDPGHGRLMKEWVAIADASAPWVALAREAHAFVKAGAR